MTNISEQISNGITNILKKRRYLGKHGFLSGIPDIIVWGSVFPPEKILREKVKKECFLKILERQDQVEVSFKDWLDRVLLVSYLSYVVSVTTQIKVRDWWCFVSLSYPEVQWIVTNSPWSKCSRFHGHSPSNNLYLNSF